MVYILNVQKMEIILYKCYLQFIKNLNIAPNSGYVLSGLIVDGNAVTASDTYTFTNVTSNHTITAAFVSANSAPSTPTVTVSSKTTSSFTVTTSATDADGDNLTYKLYVGDSLKATSSATASGTQVTLEASGLSEYTNYSYYVTATDGTETSTSSAASVRTYCSGTGATCNTSWCRDFRYCTECVNGYVACTGGTLNMDNSGGGGRCGICSEWGNYSYLCSKCDARVCNLCYDANKPHHSKRNAPTCNTCNGTGSIACSHGVREDHRYCNHYNNTDLTSHTYCSHGYTEPHD